MKHRFLSGLFLALSASTLLHASPIESMRTEGRAGWVVTDDPAPRLEWTPASTVVASWELQTAIGESDYSEKDNWNPKPFPASEGPWKKWAGPALVEIPLQPAAGGCMQYVPTVEQGDDHIHIQQGPHQRPSKSRNLSISSLLTRR